MRIVADGWFLWGVATTCFAKDVTMLTPLRVTEFTGSEWWRYPLIE